MPSTCAVQWCTNVQSKTKNVSFHRFPVKNPTLLNRWLVNMNIPKYSKSSVICSNHFKSSDYKMHTDTKILRDNAVPVSFVCKTPPRSLRPLPVVTTVNNTTVPALRSGLENDLNKIKKRKLNFFNDEETDVPMAVVPSEVQMVTDTDVLQQYAQSIYKDHCYPYLSPKTSAKKVDHLTNLLEQQCRKIKIYAQQVRRLKRQLIEKDNIINDLKSQVKNRKLYSDGKFSDTLQQLLECHSKGAKPKQYPALIRQFSVSLNFYSAHAYNFLRKYFTLPHPRTIRTWAAAISGKAGFTNETLNQIKEETSKTDYPVYATLMFDEMAIKKQVDFNGKEVIGYCDLGAEFSPTEDPALAKEALVFYCKGFNASWKFPIGYCLIAGLNAEIKSILVMEYLKQLQETGVTTVALTCDGTSTNLNVLSSFGIQSDTTDHCSFTYCYEGEEFQSRKIHGILDPAHMLKLLRNLLADLGSIYDNEGKAIEWKYFSMLNDLQKDKGMHCANKLRDRHINFENQKMKVNLAAQTFSNSVANALLFLRDVMQLQQFENVGPTINFIQMVDKTFPIVGFILDAHSMRSMAEELVWSQDAPLKYLLGRNISQDHVEKFFSSIRKRTVKDNFNSDK